MRLYLDSAPVIYLVEQVAPYSAMVDARLQAPGVAQVVSDLTRMECRVKPVRDSDSDLLRDFDDYFADSISETIALSSAVMDEATRIRATYGFSTPDAVHLAAAVIAGRDAFLTNDHRLDRFAGLPVEVVGSARP